MHAHAFHIAQSLNGALEFPFQRPLVIHFLVKFRLPPIHLVEQFEAQSSTVRHSFAGNFQPAGVQLVAGDADRFSIRADLVRDLLAASRLANACASVGSMPVMSGLKSGVMMQVSEEKDHPGDERRSAHQAR